jgi:hypothetical protein
MARIKKKKKKVSAGQYASLFCVGYFLLSVFSNGV